MRPAEQAPPVPVAWAQFRLLLRRKTRLQLRLQLRRKFSHQLRRQSVHKISRKARHKALYKVFHGFPARWMWTCA